MYIDTKMIESGFQLQCAAADVFPSRLYRDCCLLVEQLRWLVSDPRSDTDFPSQYGATRLLTAREQSPPHEQLIKPNFLGMFARPESHFSSETCFPKKK